MRLDNPQVGSGPADPLKVKEFWADTVVQAERLGKLEKVPTRLATTTRERDQARAQNTVIFRHSFGGWGDNYDNIQWGKHA
jgi:hypothetical protein